MPTTNGLHYVTAEPCEHGLRSRLLQMDRAGYNQHQGAFDVAHVRSALEQMERYRSEISELRNRLDAVPATHQQSHANKTEHHTLVR